MLDFLLGIFFVFLFLRGWARGFVKEAMDLLGVIFGLAIAFRLSPAAGAVVSGTFGSSPTVSRVIGGLVLFVLVGGVAALLAHYLQRVARLPGLALGNRLTGAGLALAWGAFLATLVLSVVSLFRLPVAVAGQPVGAGGRYFDGLIDDVRILSRAMSAAEVSQLAAGMN